MDYNKRYVLYLLIFGAFVISILSTIQLYHQSESSQSLGKSLEVVSPVIEKNIPTNKSKIEPTQIPTSKNSDKSTNSNQPLSPMENNTEVRSSSGGGGGGGGGSSGDSSPPSNSNNAPDTNTPNADSNPITITPASGDICNPLVIRDDGLDNSRIIDILACNLLNALSTTGTAAGNAGDLYYNLDDKHVNLCFDWTPNPDCPQQNRLFYQHEWRFSNQGRVTSPVSSITVGQASYGGTDNHGISYVYYQNQPNADEAYRLYTNNNLYIYPSLDDDSYSGNKYDVSTMTNPVPNSAKANIANTPYVISSKQITKPGTDYYMIHDASGSELPFVKLTMATLAGFKPEIKQRLAQQITVQGQTVTFLMPTVQMLLRYSHKSINSNTDYLSSTKIHQGAYLAHDFVNGLPQPAYDAFKLIHMANDLTLQDIPPLIQLRVVSETFEQSEKLFNTPGAIARSVQRNAPKRTIVINAENSLGIDGRTDSMEYIWKTSDTQNINITLNPQNSAEATIEFYPATTTQRLDVFVFARKSNGKYYSIPGVISEYVR